MEKSRCKECDKELVGGHYNTPLGLFCATCWGKKPKREKRQAVNMTLQYSMSRLFKSSK